MTRRSTTRRTRRAAVAAMTVGMACMLAGGAGVLLATGAQADSEPGSEFGALELNGRSSVYRAVIVDIEGMADGQLLVPYAEASLKAGGLGRAMSSVAWPGSSGGNFGKVLQLLGTPCPPPNPQGVVPPEVWQDVPSSCPVELPSPPDEFYNALNDPVKAEAQTGSGEPTQTIEGGPFGSMTATATQTEAKSSSTLAGFQPLPVADTFGTTTATTTARLTGPKKAVVDSVSIGRNINLGGVITIDSITTTAHAETDGTKATGSTSTVVQRMRTPGGVLSIDDKGVSINGQPLPVGQALEQINQGLSQSGFQIMLTRPTKSVQGSNATVESTSLIISQNNDQYTSQANKSGRVIQLGGATAIASASPGFPYVALPPVLPLPDGLPSVPSGGGAVAAPAAGTGGAPLPPGAAPSLAPPGTGDKPILASNALPLPGGLSPLLVILTLFGAGLFAAGFRRLPDQVLLAAGASCPLGETR